MPQTPAPAKVQWQSAAQRVRLIGRATHRESAGERIAEALTVHLRHHRRITARLHSLAFAQAQQDPFQRLRSRTLLGAGARADLLRRGEVRLSLGSSPMGESERIEDGSARRETWRLSSFLAARREPREGASVEATSFYQPRIAVPADARVAADLTLEVRLRGGLSLLTTAGLQHDSRPPGGVERTDRSYETGFGLRL